MNILSTVVYSILCYLAGSVNFAIIVTRLARGEDIRKLGTGNPGTANVGRSIGKGWAALVLVLDIAKVLVPLILGKRIWFGGGEAADYISLFAGGIAGVAGHCKPLYYRFRGGGGIATSIGVFLFFIPLELAAAIGVGLLVAVTLLKTLRFRIARGVSIMIPVLASFFTFLSTRFTGIHPEELSRVLFPGVLATGLFILSVNLAFMKNRLRELFGRKKTE